jgi:hypothetical protein
MKKKIKPVNPKTYPNKDNAFTITWDHEVSDSVREIKARINVATIIALAIFGAVLANLVVTIILIAR